MAEYLAPLETLRSQLNHVARTHGVFGLEDFSEVTEDLVEAVLDEAGRFAERVLAPINRLGDQHGAVCRNGAVTVPDEFVDAFAQFVDSGWPALSGSPEFAGQGLPEVLVAGVFEMFSAANLAFTLCPKLTQGGVFAISHHASEALQKRYLEPLISGRFTASMDLTEPAAGSDLARVTSMATPDGDHYRLRGRKIYITWGDHNMAENVIHLVLARTPDAAAGSAGLSLFLVPKFLLEEDGSCGRRNDMQPLSIEHKMGIHCSPTCVMSYGEQDGAVAYLVGPEGAGLACMFTMMNHMRLGVGLQGVGVMDRAYQDAVAYARERVQGYLPGRGSVKIIQHGDVRRMLLTMRALTVAARAIVLETAAALDRGAHGTDPASRHRYQRYADLLTPIAKGWCTEVAQEAAYLSVQVFGGMGFIEESGVAQHMRDARILPIYEGTNGIQALDLVGRKLLKQGDAGMRGLIGEVRQLVAGLPAGLASAGARLGAGAEALERATDWLIEHAEDDPNTVSATAFNYLMLSGTVAGGWLSLRHALAAQQAAEKGAAGYLLSVQFYLEQIMPRCESFGAAVTSGARSIIDFPEAMF